MKVILLKAIQKIGKQKTPPERMKFEVNEGFARNSLFPRGLATPATPSAVAELSRKQSARAADKAVRRTLLDNAIEAAAGKSLVYHAPANDQGNLFSKIDAKAIAQFLLSEHRLDIDPACIHLEEGSIKKTGPHRITIKDGSYEATVDLTVEKK